MAEDEVDTRKQAAAFAIVLLFVSPLLVLVLMIPAVVLYWAGQRTAAGALLVVFAAGLLALFAYGFARRRKT